MIIRILNRISYTALEEIIGKYFATKYITAR